MHAEAHRKPAGLSRLLLAPLSLLYKTGAFLALLARGRRPRSFPGLFVISVDGLSFGGSGKTPLVAAIAAALLARGCRVAIVSRGYRSRLERAGGLVAAGHDSATAGDEPLMLKRRFPASDVFVGRDRLRSLAAAAARGNRFAILDDGLQSAHIRKDFSVMLVNPDQPYHYLRHFRFLARRADRLLAYRRAARRFPGSDGGYDFALDGLYDAEGRARDVGREPLVAFSALGDNDRFARDLGRFNLAAFVPFPDHHAYSAADLRELEALRSARGAAWLVCSEKDFVKAGPLAGAGLPLLQARNEIQLPGDLIPQIIAHAEKKGFL